jgi:hypothetical protein
MPPSTKLQASNSKQAPTINYQAPSSFRLELGACDLGFARDL